MHGTKSFKKTIRFPKINWKFTGHSGISRAVKYFTVVSCITRRRSLLQCCWPSDETYFHHFCVDSEGIIPYRKSVNTNQNTGYRNAQGHNMARFTAAKLLQGRIYMHTGLTLRQLQAYIEYVLSRITRLYWIKFEHCISIVTVWHVSTDWCLFFISKIAVM
jgi:hypothetical protein